MINGYSIIDFETGGLSSLKNPITELGALGIKGDTLEEVDRFDLLCKPDYNTQLVYEPKALEVTGISLELLRREGVDIKVIVDRCIEHFEKLNVGGNFRTKPVLVGQNLKFDINFLFSIFEHCKKDLSKYVDGDKNKNGIFIPEYIDTLKLAKMAFGHTEMPNYKLGTIVEKFQLQLVEAHRSMADVVATKDILVKCIIKLRSQGNTSVEEEYRTRTHFQF